MSLNHAFVSPKPDGADVTLLRPSNWNADHVFSGGVAGNLLVRDTGPSGGTSWSDGMLWRAKGLFIKGPSGPSLILQSGSVVESNSQSPLVIGRGADGTVCTTFIDAFGGINTVAAIRLLGNFSNMGSIAADGTFTPVSTAGSGISSMIDCLSDTTVGIVVKTAPGGTFYAAQFLDSTGKFVHSIKEDGTLSWGAGVDHASEDTTLGRIAAGKLQLGGGSAQMLLFGGSGSSNAAIKGSGTTISIRRSDDAAYAELDVATIHPASGIDFRLKQNAVDAFTSIDSGAVVNTLYLHGGKVGIQTDPVARLHVNDGSANFIASNNSFGNDWIVLTNDINLASSKYFLAESASAGTLLNARSGLILSFKIGNAEKWQIDANGLFKPSSTNTIVAKTKAGTPVDGDFAGVADGMVVVDTTANKIWVRTGSAWKGVAVA